MANEQPFAEIGVRASLDHRIEAVNRRPRYLWLNEAFRRLAHASSHAFGSPWMFIAAVLICLLWVVTGPIFHYSETWHLIINDLTNIITFLAVFLIQNTQNREGKAIHLKLDELLRAVEGARTGLVNLESLSDQELDRLQMQFERLRERESRKRADPVSHKGA